MESHEGLQRSSSKPSPGTAGRGHRDGRQLPSPALAPVWLVLQKAETWNNSRPLSPGSAGDNWCLGCLLRNLVQTQGGVVNGDQA